MKDENKECKASLASLANQGLHSYFQVRHRDAEKKLNLKNSVPLRLCGSTPFWFWLVQVRKKKLEIRKCNGLEVDKVHMFLLSNITAQC
jgi:hypothetical protein